MEVRWCILKIQVVIEEASGQTTIEDIVQLEKGVHPENAVGLTLLESKQLLQALQRTIVLNQAANYSKAHQDCPYCRKKRRVKGYHTLQFRTLFGIIAIPSLRLYHCACDDSTMKSFSMLNEWWKTADAMDAWRRPLSITNQNGGAEWRITRSFWTLASRVEDREKSGKTGTTDENGGVIFRILHPTFLCSQL